MKRIYTIFAFAAIAAAFASCNKNEYAATSGRTLSINVGTETKTLLRNGTTVHWSNSDKIRIFDTEYNGFTFVTENTDVPSATFTCKNWTGTTPVFAVHSNTKNIGDNAYDGTVVTSNLNPSQLIYHKNSYGKESALSVEKVTENDGSYSVETMKNCFALLCFTLESSTITSVTLTGNNDEYIAGWVDVNYDNLVGGKSFWTVNTDKGGAKTITVEPTGSACKVKDNGAFADRTKYYISVLPQTLSKGVTIVLTKADKSYATLVVSSSITLERSKVKSFSKPLDQGLVFTKDDFELDFTTIGGSTFKYDNEGAASDLPRRTSNPTTPTIPQGTDFWSASCPDYIFNGGVRFWNTDGGSLGFDKNSYIRFPRVSDFKLAKITEFEVVHAGARNYKITSAPAGTYADGVPVAGGEEKSLKKDSDPASFILTDEYDADKDYYVVCNSEAGIRFKLFYKYIGQE